MKKFLMGHKWQTLKYNVMRRNNLINYFITIEIFIIFVS